MGWLWDWVRPHYNGVIALLGRSGLERTINGTDRILIYPRFRQVSETYEPQVWNHLVAQVRPGDVVADVGAFIGLYTVSLAKRVGPFGRVVAFEPDPENFTALKAQVELNRVSDRVELIQAAAGVQNGTVPFEVGRASESHVGLGSENGARTVQCVRLDDVFADRRLDIIKIDVEGYEEEVLKGSARLLQDDSRRPRAIYIEVHPYAWPATGTSSESLLGFLSRCNYQVVSLNGQTIEQIDSYGEIVARRRL
jgi:FkbM family methyltransferase